MATKLEIVKLMAILSGGLPAHRDNVDDAKSRLMVEIYTKVLADLDYAILEAAALHWISQDNPFFPSAGQIREAVFAIVESAQQRVSGVEAWGAVKRLVVRYGRDNWDKAAAEMDEPTKRSAEAIGWRDLCMSDVDDEMSWRARFVQAYEAINTRERETARMLPAVKTMAAQIQAGTQQLTAKLAAPKERA